MTLSNSPGSIKKFRRTPWRFQATFATPLQQLNSFVSTILWEDGDFEKATIMIDDIVFDPKNLMRLLTVAKLPSTEIAHDCSITAEGRAQVHILLETTLSDWIDFAFVPAPKPFVIYADHDEYTTFYANTKANLNRVVQSLLKQGFSQILDYQRGL